MAEATGGYVLPGMEAVVRPPEAAPVAGRVEAAPRVKAVDRGQTVFGVVEVSRLIEEDHPARAIWEFVGRMELGGFYEGIKAVEGVAGREPWGPRLLISVWIYAYSRGIGSAREIARRCEYDPAFQWLTGMQEINYHTLSDFRVSNPAALEELFVEALGVLSAEGLIRLDRVMQDGTKVQASAGSDSFRREPRVREHLEAARQQVAAMGEPTQELTPRQRAARQRAARERQERMERAVSELEDIRQAKNGEEAKEQARVSLTDPEARIMKGSDGGCGPSYNVQVSTDAAEGMVVGVRVSQCSSDYGELADGVDPVEENLGRKPRQVVVDGGFTSRQNILEMDRRGVDLIGSLDDHSAQLAGHMERRGVSQAFYPQAFAYDAQRDECRCPAGQVLRHESQEKRVGVTHHTYRAAWAACSVCPHKGQCCPKNEGRGRSITRAVEAPAVQRFLDKMGTEAAKAIYRLRGAVAEFSNCWIKAKLGLRQFHVRGLDKVRCESVWACLTYNIQQWTRLRWRGRLAVEGVQ
jgi:transposase